MSITRSYEIQLDGTQCRGQQQAMQIALGKFKFNITFTWDKPAEIPPDKLLFDRRHLGGLLRPYYDNKTNLVGILLSQLSVLVTIILTLLVSDIGNKWGIAKELWSFIITFTFAIIAAWSVFIVIKIIRQPSFDAFLSDVISNSLTAQERRFVFLITANDSAKSTRVLVQFSESWECWLLPNFSKSQSEQVNNIDKLRSALASKLGADPSELLLTALNDDLISTKLSYKNGKITTYYFDFFQAAITSKDLSEKLSTQSLDIGGTKFSWMTIAEMKSHQTTRQKNDDVINHLEDCIFANGAPPLSMKDKVELKCTA
jgi:hypothetical protein